jgi:DNA-binding NarL/FixJ family response regulator
VKILIVDDHRLFLQGVASLVEREPDMEVAGLACSGDEALSLAEEHRPDVAILDVSMPGMNGIETLQRMRALSPEIRGIALSIHEDRRFVVRMLEAGAWGYVLKECDFSELLCAVRVVSRGLIYLSPKVSTDLVRDYLRLVASGRRETPSCLSPREMEVLSLLVEGKSVKAAAAVLHISPNTADTHKRNIMGKTHCESLADLTRYALREGLIDPEAV